MNLYKDLRLAHKQSHFIVGELFLRFSGLAFTVMAPRVPQGPNAEKGCLVAVNPTRITGEYIAEKGVEITNRSAVVPQKFITPLLRSYHNMLGADGKAESTKQSLFLNRLEVLQDMKRLIKLQLIPYTFVIKFFVQQSIQRNALDKATFRTLMDESKIDLTEEMQAMNTLRDNCAADDYAVAKDPKGYFDLQYGKSDMSRLLHFIIQHDLTPLEASKDPAFNPNFVTNDFASLCDDIEQQDSSCQFLDFNGKNIFRFPRVIGTLTSCLEIEMSDAQRGIFIKSMPYYVPDSLMADTIANAASIEGGSKEFNFKILAIKEISSYYNVDLRLTRFLFQVMVGIVTVIEMVDMHPKMLGGMIVVMHLLSLMLADFAPGETPEFYKIEVNVIALALYLYKMLEPTLKATPAYINR